MTSGLKTEKIIHKIYCELYAAADPAADFDILMEESPRNEKGQIMIPYNDYKISYKLYNEIVENILKDFKANRYIKQAIRNTINLGCSPVWTEYYSKEM